MDQSLQNTNTHNKVTKSVRKFVPSSMEINFLIQFKPMSIKVYLLNNNYYTVELANHYDTIQDVLGILYNYIGLGGDDCRGTLLLFLLDTYNKNFLTINFLFFRLWNIRDKHVEW